MKARPAAVMVCAALAACSYLQPKAVGDEYVQGTRTAVVDVLAGLGLATRSGPDCVVSEDATSLTCTAQTTSGARAEAYAAGGDSNDLESAELRVSVDGDDVYEGSVAGVLASANE